MIFVLQERTLNFFERKEIKRKKKKRGLPFTLPSQGIEKVVEGCTKKNHWVLGR